MYLYLSLKVCLYLYMAVLPRNQKMLTHLAEVMF